MSSVGSETRRRTLFLIDELGGGGAQKSAILVASALHRLGLPALIVAARGGSYEGDIEPGLEIRLVSPMWPRIAAIPPFIMGLRRVVGVERITEVFTNGFAITRIVLLLQLIGALHGVRVVVVEHSTLSVALVDRFPNRLMRSTVRMLTRLLYRRADAIVGVSDGVARDLETTLGLPPGTVVTIYNPVDAGRIVTAIDEPVPSHLAEVFADLPRPFTITSGRLVTQKAHRDLLAAFAGLPEAQRGSLVILGEGPLRADLERQARELGIEERVWMPGFVDNPWWFMARADVFVLSSHWEGHPMVLLEALACGLPVVATDCPSGPREILAGAPGTRLTPVGDTNALTQAIQHLLTDPRAPEIDLDCYRPAHIAQQYLRFSPKAGT